MNYKIPKNLLSKGSTNAKTSKNPETTYILYLAPYTQNSKKINICPKASSGCAAACLFSAGRGAFSNVIQSRVNKTEYYLHDKEKFILQLASELVKINKKAATETNQTLIRLNGTSDLDFVYLLKKYANFDISNYRNLHFYDYTKILGKVKKYIDHKNYTLTFSRAEDNELEALQALDIGSNVAAVFSGDLPKKYKGYTVVDGDKTDSEMLDFKGVILGLKAKGKARKDNSGFVIKTI
tara:strand:- start:1859 stop:2572 length:714 start_codon:yes stop_codon:yes gene_type:complete